MKQAYIPTPVYAILETSSQGIKTWVGRIEHRMPTQVQDLLDAHFWNSMESAKSFSKSYADRPVNLGRTYDIVKVTLDAVIVE